MSPVGRVPVPGLGDEEKTDREIPVVILEPPDATRTIVLTVGGPVGTSDLSARSAATPSNRRRRRRVTRN